MNHYYTIGYIYIYILFCPVCLRCERLLLMTWRALTTPLLLYSLHVLCLCTTTVHVLAFGPWFFLPCLEVHRLHQSRPQARMLVRGWRQAHSPPQRSVSADLQDRSIILEITTIHKETKQNITLLRVIPTLKGDLEEGRARVLID